MSATVGSGGAHASARNVGHIIDDDDDDMPAQVAHAAVHNGVALDLTKNGAAASYRQTPQPQVPQAPPPVTSGSLSPHRRGAGMIGRQAGKDGLPVLMSTPTFVLSYPSFTVGPLQTSQPGPTSAPSHQGCETDTGVLVIDEDYEC